MQPVNTSDINNQITPTFQIKPSELNPAPSISAPRESITETVNPTADIVTLSTDSIEQSAKTRKPSTPVSLAEKELLLKMPSGKRRFSTDV